MDVIHHTVIGAVGYTALSSGDYEIAGFAFLLGSVIPDLDVIFGLFGKRAYLKNHQGVSHSLLLSPLLAAAISFPMITTYFNGFSNQYASMICLISRATRFFA